MQNTAHSTTLFFLLLLDLFQAQLNLSPFHRRLPNHPEQASEWYYTPRGQTEQGIAMKAETTRQNLHAAAEDLSIRSTIRNKHVSGKEAWEAQWKAWRCISLRNKSVRVLIQQNVCGRIDRS